MSIIVAEKGCLHALMMALQVRHSMFDLTVYGILRSTEISALSFISVHMLCS